MEHQMHKPQYKYISFNSIEDKDIADGEKDIGKEIKESFIKSESDIHLKHEQHNPLLGYAFMLLGMVGMTMNHFFGKLALYHNPNLSNFDVVLFIGL